MPLADPSTSFDVAARHLFRHLHEPSRLRRNPLVRRFFEDRDGRVTHARAKTAIATILRTVHDGAEHVRCRDVESGEGERAFRRHAIVQRTYFERAPIAEVAAGLGLSMRQYYRERASVCALIARFVEAYDDRPALSAPFSRLDPLQFRMEQASQREELGDCDAAGRTYAAVLRCATAASTKIEALCRLAGVASEQGRDAVAASHVRDARALFVADSYEMTAVARAASRCHIALTRSRIAWHMGLPHRAADTLAEAGRIADALVADGGKRARELCVEVLLERAGRREDLGEFAGALADVERVFELQHSGSEASLRQRSDAVRLRTALEMSAPQPLATPANSFDPLCEALRLARASGSAKRVVLATAQFAPYYVYAGNEAAAAETAARVTAMMDHIASIRFRAGAALILADALAPTRYWKRGLKIVSGARAAIVENSYEWAKLKHIEAEYHRRGGRMLEAHTCAAVSQSKAKTFGSRRLEGASLRGLAISAHAFGRTGEAREYLAHALSAVERHGSALSRTLTHRTIASIAG